MTVVILAYDQFLFRPLVAWADKFRMETTSSGDAPESWLLDLIRRTRLIHRLLVPLGWMFAKAARVPLRLPAFQGPRFQIPQRQKTFARRRYRVGDAGAADDRLCGVSRRDLCAHRRVAG